MGSYRAQPSRPDRAKAIIGIVTLYAAFGAFLILSPTEPERRDEIPPTILINVTEPPPPKPPPEPRADRARDEEGAAGKKAEPTPIVAPKPVIVVPAKPPVAAAPVPGVGASPNAGASVAGSGTGAGGSGNGRGGGGSGDYSGYTPARLIENVRRSDYRALTAGRLPYGSAMVSLKVETSGLPSGCRIVRSSGDVTVDTGLCPLLTRRLRFRPALDDRGRPIPYALQYVSTWAL